MKYLHNNVLLNDEKVIIIKCNLTFIWYEVTISVINTREK